MWVGGEDEGISDSVFFYYLSIPGHWNIFKYVVDHNVTLSVFSDLDLVTEETSLSSQFSKNGLIHIQIEGRRM